LCSEHLYLKGIQCYQGANQHIRSWDERKQAVENVCALAKEAKNALDNAGYVGDNFSSRGGGPNDNYPRGSNRSPPRYNDGPRDSHGYSSGGGGGYAGVDNFARASNSDGGHDRGGPRYNDGPRDSRGYSSSRGYNDQQSGGSYGRGGYVRGGRGGSGYQSSGSRGGNEAGRNSKYSPPRNSDFRLIVKGPSVIHCSWQDLKDHFRTVGDVCFADIRRDYGIIEYKYDDHMLRALNELDGSLLRGSPISVIEDTNAGRNPSHYRATRHH